jgi:FlaG/FlaF family flagellin (archaellin)
MFWAHQEGAVDEILGVVSTVAVNFILADVQHAEIYELAEGFGSNILGVAIEQAPELRASEPGA